MSSPSQQPAQLKRSLTLFAVVCLGINGVIGQGIFLLPGKAADKMTGARLDFCSVQSCFCIALASRRWGAE